MLNITEKQKCNGCHACANVCPKKCIEMKEDSEGFLYPEIDGDKCVDCHLCEKVCPVISGKNIPHENVPDVYVAFNRNEKIRMKSSSGGIFTLIAEWIINQGGIVFGAALSDDFRSVNHISVDNISDLKKLRGSKYLQSTIGNAYIRTKEYLDSGRKVLFTGTPCQIGGLYSFLHKDYENLYTQDIICHGVPSPKVWRKYLSEHEHRTDSGINNVYFRHKKKSGWKEFSLLIEFLNKKFYIKSFNQDPFMKVFLSNMCLRPSCYDCSFKSVKRQADITLADFWGIQNVCPEMDDDKGTSLVMVHSEKGRNLWKSISNDIIQKKTSADVIAKYNPSVSKSVCSHRNRTKFFENLNRYSVVELNKRYNKPLFRTRVKRFLKKILSVR